MPFKVTDVGTNRKLIGTSY